MSFPARTPAPAIRRRSSQGLLKATRVAVLGAQLFLLCWSGLAAHQSVTLSWDTNREPDLAGYRIYYRTAAGDLSEVIDVANTTTFTVPNLGEGITYLFSVTAYNNASLESQPSAEVSFTSGSVSDTTLLTVVNGTGGGNYAVGRQLAVSANPPTEGSQFRRLDWRCFYSCQSVRSDNNRNNSLLGCDDYRDFLLKRLKIPSLSLSPQSAASARGQMTKAPAVHRLPRAFSVSEAYASPHVLPGVRRTRMHEFTRWTGITGEITRLPTTHTDVSWKPSAMLFRLFDFN